ncbi:PREDICTED: syntaxin-8-like [Priapulus caudatus]|uniref:Syntaxin-8-like n=1 Tax=Priapulus caudatus TaxID=37621 RepID=A0ABM1E0I0_PRICU|nr:PREDICTED: syntaxin-8-like [Priapulus caudatus]
MEKINQRNNLHGDKAKLAKLSSIIRQMLVTYGNQVSNLKQSVMRSASTFQITQREMERRQLMVDNLTTNATRMEQAFKHESSALSNRTSLFSPAPASSNYMMPMADPDFSTDVPVSDILQQQQQAIREQDQGLEALAKVISRQKNMAHTIGHEVDYQNELLDDIHDHVDRTDQRLLRETRHVKLVDNKSNTCGYWVVIVLLLVTIIVIAAVPFKGKG